MSSQTSPTLLSRLRREPLDETAWEEFVHRYGPRILTWCRCWGLQEADAEDVTQNVLARLVHRLKSFRYDPAHRFRNWLQTVARNAWHDFVNGSQRRCQPSANEDAWQALQSVEAREDMVERLNELFDVELWEEAKARVRLRIEPVTWDAFHLTAIEGLSGPKVAAQLGMQLGAVYVARHRAQKALAEEIRELQGPDAEA